MMLINIFNKLQGSVLKRLLFPFLLLSFINLTACVPDIALTTSPEADQANNLNLSLAISNGEFAAGQSPTARLFKKFDPSIHYSVSITPDENKPEQFNLSASTPEPGPYRLAVDIPYQRRFLGIPLGSSVKTVVKDFVIHGQLDPVCYNFDDKQQDVMGWKSSNVYQGDKEAPASSTTCPGLFFVNTSWPMPLGQTKTDTSKGGSLFVPVSSECFPKSSNKLSEQPEWTFSLISPDLSEQANWQSLNSINFRIAGKELSFTVSPEVHFKIGEKLSSTYEQTTAPEKYKIQSNIWQIIEHKLSLPEEAMITHIELHISGVPEQTVGEGVNSIFIDGICPAIQP